MTQTKHSSPKMKTCRLGFVLIVSMLVSVPVWATDTNYLCGTLSPTLTATLAGIIPPRPQEIVLQEGTWSFDYSSVRDEPDYFVIPTAQGGRLLRMSPFTTSDWSPWYGILETNASLTDVVSGDTFSAPLNRNTDLATGQITHEGTLEVDGKDVYVLVTYHLTTRYPTTMLTWGIGATYGDPGIEIDNMVCPQTPTPVPANNITGMHLVKDETGSLGAFLTLVRPFHSGNQLESSPDLVNWHRIAKADIMESGDGKKLFYLSSGKQQEFFRLVNGE